MLESLSLTADAKNKKRVVYEENDKQEIGKYAAVCLVAAAIRKFKQKFPNLNESTVRPWVKKYKLILKAKKNNGESSGFAPKIGQVRSRPLLLDNELDLKPCTMLTLRTAGAGINIHVVTGVVNGLVRANPEKFGKYVDFQVTRSWVRSLYRRMKFSRRAVTTSRPIITRSFWVEVKSQFLYEISQKVLNAISLAN